MEEGLDKVLSDTPVGHGSLSANLGFTEATGLFAHAEAGYRIRQNLAAFAYVEDSQASGFAAGVGAKLTF
jgi:hypothetical protein